MEGIEANVENAKDNFEIAENLSNVYSTHGSFDPGLSLGAQKDISILSPTTIIPSESKFSFK